MTATLQGRGSAPLVSMRGITKRFGHVVANDSVDLNLYPGEVHALLGENGAGKSTLMKILYGFYNADSGSILVEGKEVKISSPQDARRLSIGMVFQNFTLIPAMTVSENIALYMPELPGVLNAREIVRSIEDFSERYKLQVKPHAMVRDIPLGDQQKVEVLKLLIGNARVLIFDEATRVLAPHEIDNLFEIFASLKLDGYAIVFITHKMREVLACADRVSVLRKGRLVATIPRSEATESALVSMMFGNESLQEAAQRRPISKGSETPLLELCNVTTPPNVLGTQLKDINLRIKAGEMVGVAGVSGNGQRELVDAILGFLPISQGARFIKGQDSTRWAPYRIRKSGVGYIPEDTLSMGVIPWMNILQNTALGDIDAYAQHGGMTLDWKKVEQDVFSAFRDLSFESLNAHVPVRTYSGGQLQRSVLARELGRNPEIVIASYPTRGLDIHSANATFRVLSRLRNRGGCVLLISEDLDDLCQYCDRLVVLYQGRVVGEFRPDQVDRHTIGYLMTGSEATRG